MRIFVLFTIGLLFFSCTGHKKTPEQKFEVSLVSDTFLNLSVEHSSLFKLVYNHNHTEVKIFLFDAYSQLDTIKEFTLVRKRNNDNKSDRIVVPVKSMALLSTVFCGFVEELQAVNLIRMVDDKSYTCDKKLISQIKSKHTIEVGGEGNLQFELLLSQSPDLLIYSGYNGTSHSNFKRLEENGTRVMICHNFLESSPLARAEWIKLFGVLVGKEQLADSLFRQIQKSYNFIQQQSKNSSRKPKVLAGAKFGDIWDVPGGKSYTATLIKDAGGDYIWNSNQSTGRIPLSLEQVLIKASDADVWIHVNSYNFYDELKNADIRYSNFKPFKSQNIYNNNNQVNDAGGNAFWEKGVVRPDLVLKDLQKIFSGKTDSLTFYKELN